MSLSNVINVILRIAGDQEEDIIKYTQKMQQIYDSARRMKLNQASRERRDDE
jgi:hypothetical protein